MLMKKIFIALMYFFFQKIRKLLNNDKVRDIDAVRLVMLYSLRYEKNSNNDIAGLIDMLKKRNTSDKLFKVSS